MVTFRKPKNVQTKTLKNYLLSSAVESFSRCCYKNSLELSMKFTRLKQFLFSSFRSSSPAVRRRHDTKVYFLSSQTSSIDSILSFGEQLEWNLFIHRYTVCALQKVLSPDHLLMKFLSLFFYCARRHY